MNKPIYVLGTGLSHNGSAVLLKDGAICVAIEKERITRRKHDGGNDTQAIQYCLDAAGITLDEVAVVVQCANFEIPDRNQFHGKRIFATATTPEIISISHHLAHAYSAVGTAPFNECAVMVIDGCGSPLQQYLELHPEDKLANFPETNSSAMICEKDSFYHFDGQKLTPLFKDFSPMSGVQQSGFSLPTTKHSIGGFYAAISNYVFGDMDDVGKLMGLAPFGNSGIYTASAFRMEEDRLLVTDDWQQQFTKPSENYAMFKANFQYYADVAKWAQEQVEKAILDCISSRLQQFPHTKLCYSGGVALNAVANAKLEDLQLVDAMYIEPAAADNGLALGCAFYGWLAYLKQPKITPNGSTCFGKKYTSVTIQEIIQFNDLSDYKIQYIDSEASLVDYVAQKLHIGKTIAWFQSESEFGPRALGRRSILAHPGIPNLKNHINSNIKFREDFRPFAPAVLEDKVQEYFEKGRYSPYMILVDQTKKEFRELLQNVTHQDGSARVQTVSKSWNSRFYNLIASFYAVSGIAVLLNTSLNRKGMPMVETPQEAIDLFTTTALDVLVLENYVIEKQ